MLDQQVFRMARSAGSIKRPAPRWLHEGGVCPQGDVAAALWRAAAIDNPASSIYLMPSCALAGPRESRPPVIYADWVKGAPVPKLRSLAVLRPSEPLLPGLPFQAGLRGRKVLDNTLLGDNSPEAMRRFIAAMGGMLHRGEADYILFRDLEVASSTRGIIAEESQRRQFAVFEPSGPVPHWWIRFPEKPQEYWAQFSKKTRYNFRYRAKHLDHTVRCLNSSKQVPEFVERVQSLIQRTWQHRRLEKLFDVEERIDTWLQFAEAGAFRCYLLEQDTRVVAFVVGFQWKGTYFYDETGYDPADAAKSPGQVLLYRVLEDLIARDTPRLLDFGFGDSEYKRMFANHETHSGPLALVRRSLVPMTSMMLLRARSKAGRYTRLILNKTGLLSPIRHLYRGHGGAALKPAGGAAGNDSD